MRKVWGIFVRDLKKIASQPFAMVVFIGIIIIPSLYAWFNIRASWDPYSNTDGLKVAVVNQDDGSKVGGVTVNVGDMVVSKLADNHQIGWMFMEYDEAMEGINSGTYYAVVVIPDNFSEKIASVLSLDVENPKIEYYVNEKKNAIAPKITDKGVTVLQQQVNETFISTATEAIMTFLQETNTEVGDAKKQIVSTVMTNLNAVSTNLDTFSTSITSVKEATSAVNSVLKATKSLLPQTQAVLDSAISIDGDVMSVIDSSKSINEQMTEVLSSTVDTSVGSLNDIKDKVNNAFDMAGSNSQDVIAALEGARVDASKIIDLNNIMIEALSKLKGAFPVFDTQLNDLIDRLNTSNDNLGTIISQLDNVKNIVNQGGNISAEIRDEINGKIDEAVNNLNNASNTFNSVVAPELNATLDSVYGQLDTLSSILQTINGTTAMSDSIDNMTDAIGHTVNALDGVNQLIASAKTEINSVIDKVNATADSEKLSNLVELLDQNPDITAKFMSSPVELESTSLYPVENYGSGMAPFYTILCLWVGGLILAAILKCDVKEDDEIRDIKHWQEYLGRYLIFMFAGVFQALLVCLGDLYIFRIQCRHPILFVIAGVVASIVFTNIVYTFTSSFGDIGKALAVIMLVVQVAGAGGTFPVEVLPKFFQAVNPLMPFTYGINAMRECVAGIYKTEYIDNIFHLIIYYIPITLLIGVVFRKQVIRLKHYLEEKMEKTGIM